jgi:predicted O-methyltransferase YrrM
MTKSMKRLIRRVVGFRLHQQPPFRATDTRYSLVSTISDDPYRPSDRLVRLAIEVARVALDTSLDEIAKRPGVPPEYCSWPGEHYRLLAAMVSLLKPSVVIEVGTYTGLSALAIKQYLPARGMIATFDVVGWRDLPSSALTPTDFEDARLVQHVADLSNQAVVSEHRDLLERADLIFIDGPHDGETETRIVKNLRQVNFRSAPLLVFDDIRLWDLLRFWRELPLPKLDITSFGHWSGTGIAEWTPDSASD